MQHILTAEQFDHDQMIRLFTQADHFKKEDGSIVTRRKNMKKHSGRIMLSMFYEPSTRTRFSFEIAAAKLGIAVIGTENAAEFSSAAKGETIEDTVKVFNEYGVDAINLRTKEEGHAKRAADVSTVAVINGGDGKAEHPTQAVLDLYTIYKQFNRLHDLRITIGGDLAHGRTARSLALLLSHYPNNHITFVSAPELAMGADIKDILHDRKTSFSETANMQHSLTEADVVYWTRMQLERHDEAIHINLQNYMLDATALAILPETAIIMHPLPRNQEIPISTDNDPRAKYFEQAGNGLYIRMAMLDQIMNNLT
ncbi:MAG TPA: aspartate carbamoyltransferase catalytic subunit [Candidatus Saccharimonadales bacterium]|nr:aspartate carbamoyltransferase catalytic subunit [Candidatus Saccharimonadales bacterium]